MGSKKPSGVTRRDAIKQTGSAALGLSLLGADLALAQESRKYNILMIVSDQQRYFPPEALPPGFRLPGHEKLASRGVVFENHQIASNVCTPSRAVIYTGKHIQNNGVFDNVDFPWCDDLSTDLDTVGDMLRKEGYYTAYKGKFHLNNTFETTNDIHFPKKLLAEEMEEYGFSDYFGIGDIIAHTEGGYLHDGVIAAMSRAWLRGRAENLRRENKPWFLAVNLVNPHDVMYYNTDLPGETQQSGSTMMRVNREPNLAIYQDQWDVRLPASRNQAIDGVGRPPAHLDYQQSRGALVGVIPNEDARWRGIG